MKPSCKIWRNCVAIAVAIGVLAIISGCATTHLSAIDHSGTDEFREWARNAVSGRKSRPQDKLFKEAYHGDSVAIRAFLQEALDVQMLTAMKPADEEWLVWIFDALLYKHGDIRFAALLDSESPRTQAAVGHFLRIPADTKRAHVFPRTRELLRNAPKIDFPLEQTYRRNNA